MGNTAGLQLYNSVRKTIWRAKQWIAQKFGQRSVRSLPNDVLLAVLTTYRNKRPNQAPTTSNINRKHSKQLTRSPGGNTPLQHSENSGYCCHPEPKMSSPYGIASRSIQASISLYFMSPAAPTYTTRPLPLPPRSRASASSSSPSCVAAPRQGARQGRSG